MRRLFAALLSALLVFGFAPVAKADVAGLTPCSESARFQQRAAAANFAEFCGRSATDEDSFTTEMFATGPGKARTD